MTSPLKQVPERLLGRLWAKRAWHGLTTGDGRRFRVLYPGRRGTGAGPDFRDALLYQEGLGLLRGDVEVHTAQREWQAHGHHRDPRYNGVVLHLVERADNGATVLASGARVPVATVEALEPQEARWSDRVLWGLLGRQGYQRPASVAQWGELLDRAGDARYEARCQQFAQLLAEGEPEQLLYEGLMEALGYKANTSPFLLLAHGLPYASLRLLAQGLGGGERLALLMRLLLEAAGFARAAQGRPGLPVVPEGRWCLGGLRPANHPRRRLEGMASLVHRCLDEGLLRALLRLVELRHPPALLAGLVVKGDGLRGPALIGWDRAADMAVNVVLPFLGGWAGVGGPRHLGPAALEMYGRFPALQENEITREMRRLLLPAEAVARGARRQQGLLHLHRLLQGARW